MATSAKPRVATVWLGGCSGCHMSLLDLDERLIELADRMELVFSPIADVKEYPANVDVALVEGAVSSEEHEHMARLIRTRSRCVVSFGDCATTGNVTALRNRFSVNDLMKRSYVELAPGGPAMPSTVISPLADTARPLHEVIPVDAFLHGCPPTAEEIWFAVDALLQGRIPELPNVYLRYG
ncbi:MAG: oxidoreductase [Ignavibacteria bacterium GWA2_55_11]|nr:MAG: oxidoreductase [Ignavibacteria bacterium GWA2_55_11]OGU75622.1 MAG: oxidoreductase [Ignavibacteria bacterium RIFCSPLOWO2_02_FULL_55_14]OGU76666.1 MAG: oxidoreductase [Ignavibacteria bacterium RIFCSPLOWO2_12_FULL_56_21]